MRNSIVVGFSRPKARFRPFADAIMLVDGTDFSHAYIRLYSEAYERDLIYQASGLRVNFIGFPLFAKDNNVVHEFELDISSEAKQRLIQYAIDHVGISYSLPEVFGILAVKSAALVGAKITNPLQGDGFFCSEVAAIILRDYFGAQFTDEDAARMTPADVYYYLSMLAVAVPRTLQA